VYYHVDPTGKRCPYSDADNSAISAAKANGTAAVRINDVVLPDGTTLEFEVRFGENAVSKRLATPPPSGIIQVNLGSENTRVVVEERASSFPRTSPPPPPPLPSAHDVFFHIDPHGRRCDYSSVDNATIAAAKARGDPGS
jgi:hypothetical protein